MKSWYICLILLRAGRLHVCSIFDSSVLLKVSSDHSNTWSEINNLCLNVEEIKIWFSEPQYETLVPKWGTSDYLVIWLN